MTQADTEGRDRLQRLIGEDYRLHWIIGHGGMSTVWLADDVRHDREVAIKVLRPEFSDNTEFLHRFRNEAHTAQSIRHPHVITTYDYREIPDPAGHTFCFIAMEYIRGESLADLIAREGALPEDMVLTALDQAAHGLAAIHSLGLVHRDIKPGNLLITQSGAVKITDFGIAKAAAAVPLTRTGMVVGTAQYVSPEQAQGQRVTAASDVYSLGVVGYEMLSGHRPFNGDSQVSVVLAHINEAPPALSTTISAPTRELIGISLRKDPTTRFADGAELATAVTAVLHGHRPPQPAATRAGRAAATPAEPSPSAATSSLGAVTQNRTAYPMSAQGAAGRAGAGGRAGRAAARPQRRKRGAGRGFLIGLLATLILVLLLGGGIVLGSRVSTTTPTTTPVVTETVEPSEPSEYTEYTQAPVEPEDTVETSESEETSEPTSSEAPPSTTSTTSPLFPEYSTTIMTTEATSEQAYR
ncbi:serine/threonine protein kinase [Corynebacterium uropygiale]|uniref:non-specific serine/threonine protein kinase n=1 Tax=Corynebacterium uropygiale TaxID=1775911 RepID=A0A9X1TYR9_9CORY|nr:serine/threonine-protein kinase [Corynebacterium uropygiale]MCF4007610.1 serine/threonine protein kinase [Corynebacterium uropygiale]